MSVFVPILNDEEEERKKCTELNGTQIIGICESLSVWRTGRDSILACMYLFIHQSLLPMSSTDT